jgi:glycosyltransferase involved in cell wall biosynthesis
MIELGMVANLAHTFDGTHFHTDCLHFSMARQIATPHTTSLHGRLALLELALLYRHFRDVPLASIAESQRIPMSWANWRGTIHHGLPIDLYAFEPDCDDYFLFIGRISPEKRVDRAIDIALGSDLPLYIGAKMDSTDEGYFSAHIRPWLAIR